MRGVREKLFFRMNNGPIQRMITASSLYKSLRMMLVPEEIALPASLMVLREGDSEDTLDSSSL